MFAYKDGKCSEEFTESKPLLGIVCDVDSEGVPLRFIDYKKISENNLAWCTLENSKDMELFTSLTNGKFNWPEIKAADPEGTATEELCKKNYPAFYECSKKTDDSVLWYIPSRDELAQICWNKDIIDESLKKLPESYGATLLKGSGSYWSSSHCRAGSLSECSWSSFMGAGTPQLKNTRSIPLSVRAIACFN